MGGWAALASPLQVGGIGGTEEYRPTSANVYFFDDGRLRSLQLNLYVAEVNAHSAGIESLLGRDILSGFVLSYDQSRRVLTLG